MTKVTDEGPKKINEEELKAKLIAEHEAKQVRDTKFPTEIIDLPSQGVLYPEGHPLAGGQIEMKYMTAKEEDILASPNLIKQGVVIDKLLQSMIITPVNYGDLLVGDKNAIMIAARVLGYGKEYSVEVNCGECGEKNAVSIDLTTIEDKPLPEGITKGENLFTFKLPQSQKEITFRLLTHGLEKAIDTELKGLEKITAKTGIDKELTTRLKHIIVAVDGISEPAEIRDFVDNQFFALDSKAFREHILSLQPDVDLSFEYTCTECGEYHGKVDIPIDVHFFWPGA